MPTSPAWTRDELLLACALVVENGWKSLNLGDPRIADLSDLLRSLPIHEGAAQANPKFRSTGSVRFKSSNLATLHAEYTGVSTKGGRLDQETVAAFRDRPTEMSEAAAALREAISSGELHTLPEDPDEVDDRGNYAIEGRLLARRALYRERDRGLRDLKIAQAEKRGQPLQCEVCTFDFGRFYGSLGRGYIEVHHVLPLHVSGPRETRLDDLAFLCANCHRMCHKSRSGESWRTPATLRAEMAQSTSQTSLGNHAAASTSAS